MWFTMKLLRKQDIKVYPIIEYTVKPLLHIYNGLKH
jgi:hypothetical protein